MFPKTVALGGVCGSQGLLVLLRCWVKWQEPLVLAARRGAACQAGGPLFWWSKEIAWPEEDWDFQGKWEMWHPGDVGIPWKAGGTRHCVCWIEGVLALLPGMMEEDGQGERQPLFCVSGEGNAKFGGCLRGPVYMTAPTMASPQRYATCTPCPDIVGKKSNS